MGKRYYLPLFLLLFTQALLAQPFGNEWIQYNQSYYRINVWNDGVYRISFSALSEAIPALAAADPRNVQIFGRGQEVPIYVQGETDGTWDAGDFIEFVGQKNTQTG